MKRKGRISELDYREQNEIQNVASRYGCILTYKQMVQYHNYRKDKVFADCKDQAILYLVLTSLQRTRFEQVRDEYGF